jgi:dynein heavy chain
LLEILS